MLKLEGKLLWIEACEEGLEVNMWLAAHGSAWLLTAADSEGAARPGDQETTELFQPDAAARRVGSPAPAVTYVAPLASSLTVPLAASQHHYVTSYVHVWRRTHTH